MSRIKTNIIYNLSYQILILILPLITAPYLSRVLGVDGIGTYSYVLSVAYYFQIAITLGLSNYGNRAIAKVKDNHEMVSQVFWSIYFMQMSLGVVVTIAYLLYSLYFVEPVFKSFFLAFIPYIISASLDINWFFFGLTDFKFTTIRNTVIKVISVVAIFLFVKTKDDLLVYFIIMGLTFLLSNILLWTRVKTNTSFYKPTIQEITVHIKPNLILFIPILAMSVYRVMDKIMIKELSSITENGYYENADKIITMALTAFSAVATVMMPSVSNMVAQGKKQEVKVLLRDTMQISMFLGFGIMFGLIAVGNVFAPIFFGVEYQETGALIQVLSFTIVFSGWKAVLRSQYIIPFEKDKAYVISLVAGAVVNVICNVIFIPSYHARGAVIGTIAAELTGFIIQTAVASQEIDIWKMMREGLVFVVPGSIMLIIVTMILFHFGDSILSLSLGIIVGIIVYPILSYFTMRIYDKNRLQYLNKRYLLFRKQS